MSGLAAFALGLCAQQALLGRTWAGAQVLFEPSAPIVPTAPVIAIYAGRGFSKVEGRDLLNAGSAVSLRFELCVRGAVTAGGVTFASSSSQAVVFACIWRQIEAVFLSDDTVWAELWRRMTLSIETREALIVQAEPQPGQRVDVWVEEWRMETLAEPEIGQNANGFWADLLAAMNAAGGELAALAPLIGAQIRATPGVLPLWRSDQATIGANNDEFGALGLGPAIDDLTGVKPGGVHSLSGEVVVGSIPAIDPPDGDPAAAGRAWRDAEVEGWKYPAGGPTPPTPAQPAPAYPPSWLIPP